MSSDKLDKVKHGMCQKVVEVLEGISTLEKGSIKRQAGQSETLHVPKGSGSVGRDKRSGKGSIKCQVTSWQK